MRAGEDGYSARAFCGRVSAGTYRLPSLLLQNLSFNAEEICVMVERED
jgi:hypothetical protein